MWFSAHDHEIQARMRLFLQSEAKDIIKTTEQEQRRQCEEALELVVQVLQAVESWMQTDA